MNQKKRSVACIFLVSIFLIAITRGVNATEEMNQSKEEYQQCIGINPNEEYVLIFQANGKIFISHNEIIKDSTEMEYLRKEWPKERVGTTEEVLSFLGIAQNRFDDIIKIVRECKKDDKNVRKVIVLK